jgi:secreted protein with Ig-like and vWFA domain
LDAGAYAAPVSGSANIAVLQPLTIVKVADMNFGGIVPGATAGTVVLSPSSGTVSRTGGVVATTGATGYARFAIDALGATNVNVSWGTSITLTGSAGGTMTVNPITFTHNAVPCGAGLCFPANSILFINYGGTLSVGANQTVGTYLGTFTVTAAFQ